MCDALQAEATCAITERSVGLLKDAVTAALLSDGHAEGYLAAQCTVDG